MVLYNFICIDEHGDVYKEKCYWYQKASVYQACYWWWTGGWRIDPDECVRSGQNRAFDITKMPLIEYFCIKRGEYLWSGVQGHWQGHHEYAFVKHVLTIPMSESKYSWCYNVAEQRYDGRAPFDDRIYKESAKVLPRAMSWHWHMIYYGLKASDVRAEIIRRFVLTYNYPFPDTVFGRTDVFGKRALIDDTAKRMCIHTYAIVYETCKNDKLIAMSRYMWCVDSKTLSEVNTECNPAHLLSTRNAYTQNSMICTDQYGHLSIEKCPEVTPLSRYLQCHNTDTGVSMLNECSNPPSLQTDIVISPIRRMCKHDNGQLTVTSCTELEALGSNNMCWDIANGLVTNTQCKNPHTSHNMAISYSHAICRNKNNMLVGQNCDDARSLPLTNYESCWSLETGLSLTVECGTMLSTIPGASAFEGHKHICTNSNLEIVTTSCNALIPKNKYTNCWNIDGTPVNQECSESSPNPITSFRAWPKAILCARDDTSTIVQECNILTNDISYDVEQYPKCWNLDTGLVITDRCANDPSISSIDLALNTLICSNGDLEYFTETCVTTQSLQRYQQCTNIVLGVPTNYECSTNGTSVALVQPPTENTVIFLTDKYEIFAERCAELVELNRGIKSWDFFTGNEITQECPNNQYSAQINIPQTPLTMLACHNASEYKYTKICNTHELYVPLTLNEDICVDESLQLKQCPEQYNRVQTFETAMTVCMVHFIDGFTQVDIINTSACPGKLRCTTGRREYTYNCLQYTQFNPTGIPYTFECSDDKSQMICDSTWDIFQNITIHQSKTIAHQAQSPRLMGKVTFKLQPHNGAYTLLNHVIDCTNKPLGTEVASIRILRGIPNTLVGVCTNQDQNGLFNIGGEPITKEEIVERGDNHTYYAPAHELTMVEADEYQSFVLHNTRSYSIALPGGTERIDTISSSANRIGNPISSAINMVVGFLR